MNEPAYSLLARVNPLFGSPILRLVKHNFASERTFVSNERAVSRLKIFATALFALNVVACVAEDHAHVDRELTGLSAQTELALDKIEAALRGPIEAAEHLGWSQGVNELENITRKLISLESDERSLPSQQLQAVLIQARAWDDLTQLLDAFAQLQMAQEAGDAAVVREVVQDKKFPAQIAAQNAFERGFRLGCRFELTSSETWSEIQQGLQRYSSQSTLARCHDTAQ